MLARFGVAQDNFVGLLHDEVGLVHRGLRRHFQFDVQLAAVGFLDERLPHQAETEDEGGRNHEQYDGCPRSTERRGVFWRWPI